jgi:hypothetical protein
VSPDDAWAVGSATSSDGRALVSLTLHWNGIRWSPISTHPLGARGNFKDVDAVSSDDVWAVGPGVRDVVVEHWDGARWTRFPAHPYYDWTHNLLNGVATIASDDVWAVGCYGNGSTCLYNRIMHWDGSGWQDARVPSPGAHDNQLEEISGTGSDDIWAVGTYSDDGDIDHNLYLHYDGHRWTRVRK